MRRGRRPLPAVGLLLLGALLGAGLVLGLVRALGLPLSSPGAPALALASPPADGAQGVGPYGPVTLGFNQPLESESLADRLRLDEELVEEFSVEGSRLAIQLAAPLRPGSHRLTLETGVAATAGASLRSELEIPFEVRQLEVLFLDLAAEGVPLARTEDDQRKTLSARQSVLDFAVEPNGASIVYAAANDQGGADLWRADRSGEDRQLLLACGADRCHQPAWSPDGRRIAFTRRRQAAEGASGRPRLWTLEVAGGGAAPLYQDEERSGRSPHWSPDGRWLAYYDPPADAIVLLDTDTVREQVVASRAGLPGGWSPDGQVLLAPVLNMVDEQPRLTLQRIEPASQRVTSLLGPERGWLEVGVPAWSPAGDQVALSARRHDGGMQQGIWVIAPSGEVLATVAADPAYSYGSPVWDPWGEQLLYQRFALAQDDAEPELMVWRVGAEEGSLLLERASTGRWLP